jgi:hypothetical protein
MSISLLAPRLATAICLTLSAQALPGQTQQGFLGIPWGAPRTAVEARVSLRLTSATGRYERYHVSLDTLGDAHLQDCQVEFEEGRFFGVAIQTRGPVETSALLKYLTVTFGQGTRSEDRSYQWIFDTAHVCFDEDSYGDGYLYWYRGPMNEQAE